jgi:hypothetical protein
VMSTEGGYLDDLAAEAHVDDSEATANHPGVAKQFVHFLGGGVGGHVKILGVASQQQVAYSTANQERLKVLTAQARHYLEGAIADIFAGYKVAVPWDLGGCRVCRCHWLVIMLMREVGKSITRE